MTTATDLTLSLSTVTASINASIEKIDIADWLLNLSDAEYQRCSHANVHGSAIDETIAFFEQHGISLEKAAAARQKASDDHNREEAPNFAMSIERKALQRG